MTSLRRFAFATTMALLNASVISFILTAYNSGIGTGFAARWAVNFMIAFLIVVQSILFVAPRVDRMLKRIFRENT